MLNLALSSVGFGLVTASVIALAAVGFTIQFGITNILNLAYGNTMMVCGFVAYVVNMLGLNIWLSMLCAAVFGAVVSVALNRLIFTPLIRRGTRLIGLVVVTLAIGVIMQNIVLAVGGPQFFSYRMSVGRTMSFGQIQLTVSQLDIIGVAVVVMVVLHLLLARSSLGRAMRATAENTDLARACGIRTRRVTDLVWAISGLLCGMAGVALFMNTSAFQAASVDEFSVIVIAAAMLGGVGEAYGAMLGALVIGIGTELFAGLVSPSYKNALAFGVLVVVLMVRPRGILAEVAGQREVAT